MPNVFIINNRTNHFLCDRRADFHRATPFQASDQISNKIKISGANLRKEPISGWDKTSVIAVIIFKHTNKNEP